MTAVDRFRGPIGPVRCVLEERHIIGVVNSMRKYWSPVCSIDMGRLQRMVPRVGPVQSLRGYVQSNRIRPVDPGAVEEGSVGSIHRGTLNLGRFSPIRPVH